MLMRISGGGGLYFHPIHSPLLSLSRIAHYEKHRPLSLCVLFRLRPDQFFFWDEVGMGQSLIDSLRKSSAVDSQRMILPTFQYK